MDPKDQLAAALDQAHNRPRQLVDNEKLRALAQKLKDKTFVSMAEMRRMSLHAVDMVPEAEEVIRTISRRSTNVPAKEQLELWKQVWSGIAEGSDPNPNIVVGPADKPPGSEEEPDIIKKLTRHGNTIFF